MAGLEVLPAEQGADEVGVHRYGHHLGVERQDGFKKRQMENGHNTNCRGQQKLTGSWFQTCVYASGMLIQA